MGISVGGFSLDDVEALRVAVRLRVRVSEGVGAQENAERWRRLEGKLVACIERRMVSELEAALDGVTVDD